MLTKTILSNYKSFISIENSCLVPGFLLKILSLLFIIAANNCYDNSIPPLFDDIPKYSKNYILGRFYSVSN